MKKETKKEYRKLTEEEMKEVTGGTARIRPVPLAHVNAAVDSYVQLGVLPSGGTILPVNCSDGSMAVSEKECPK